MGQLHMKLDTQFLRNKRMVKVGPLARLLYIGGLGYCVDNLTDGKIPKEVLTLIADVADRTPRRSANQLEESARWIDRGDHWEVHDYNADDQVSQRSKADVQAQRDVWKEKKRRQRGGSEPLSPGDMVGDNTGDKARESPRDMADCPLGTFNRDAYDVPRGVPTPDTDTDTDTSKSKPLSNEPVSRTPEQLPIDVPATGAGDAPKQPRPVKPKMGEVVFAHWSQAMGKRSTVVLSEDRKRKIAWAVKTYPLQDVLDAISGCAESRWHTGQNPEGKRYDDIGLILRNSAKVEEFRDAYRAKRQPTHDASDAASDAALLAEWDATEAMMAKNGVKW